MTNFTKDSALALLESDEPFPIDLEDAWQWLGFASKASAKRKLSEFISGVDYSTELLKNPSAGRPSELILLTIDCFKMLGMIAGTDKGREIRLYFLECEKIAKQKPDTLTELQILARTVAQMAEQEQRVLEQERRALEQEKQLKQAEERLTAIEAEQGRLFSPSGNKYTVLGFAKKHDLEISCNTAGQKGKKAASLCRQRDIEIERIHDPRFGYVGLYPESILIEVFK